MKTKQAYQYVRISQQDQSNWSIEGQLQTNKDYAEKLGITIIQTYIDDGRSAKDFDRPEWKKMERSLSANRKHIDYLIVTNYDRLIRNVWQGLQVLERIENKWNVRVLSAMQSYNINPQDPMFFKIRADLLVNAEFERRVISDRASFGMWQARSQGRYLGKAPFGYKNERDERNKPIIVPNDPHKVETIQFIFDEYVSGTPIGQILSKAREMGFTIKGNSAITKVLNNPTYAGLVLVHEYKANPEKIIKGIHEPLVSESIFYQAQHRINQTKRHQKIKISEDLPLRGLVFCEACKKPLTGSKSKGKLKYYWYYHCGDCRVNHNRDKSHGQFMEILSKCNWSKSDLDAFAKVAEDDRKEMMKNRNSKIYKLRNQIKKKENEINSLEEKYLMDRISDETYQKWWNIFRQDLSKIQSDLDTLESLDDRVYDAFLDNLEALTSLTHLFESGNAITKQEVYTFVFPQCSTKTLKGYRTPQVHEIFSHKIQEINELDVLEIDPEHYLSAPSPLCSPKGSTIEHSSTLFSLNQLFKKLA